MRALLLCLGLACAGGRRAEPAETPEATEPAPPTAEAPAPGAPPADVKAPGNLPVRTESELAAAAEAREACVQTCLQQRQMEARAIEAIEADCAASCQQAHPIEQVEVVPDLAPALLPDG